MLLQCPHEIIFDKLSGIILLLFVVVNVIRGRLSMTHNGLQLKEVADFEALNCLPSLNLTLSTKLHLPLNRQFLVGAVRSWQSVV